MTKLSKLKAAKSLNDLAFILGYKPSALSYILYKMPTAAKYSSFDIPKKSGGTRTIDAPCPQLKTLQKRLADLLYACRGGIEASGPKRRSLSHGFKKAHSILTNAHPHLRRRYVLNLDLEDYFPSLNFGRVRGFFIKNHGFELDPKVATVVAQIACYDNALPQGSPCSPIISDLMTHLLDVRMAQLAKANGCTYSRYADDLTFSTNLKLFPQAIAHRDEAQPGSEWQLGEQLLHDIAKAGFSVKSSKTRMQVWTGRQLVTGLTVNRKVNIRGDYYRTARSMCHSLFATGEFTIRPPVPTAQAADGSDAGKPALPNQLYGVLAHIHFVKDRADLRASADKRRYPTGSSKLFEQFLFYFNFLNPSQPVIICEGRTDPIYLRAAIKKLGGKFPSLFDVTMTPPRIIPRFFRYSGTTHAVMSLSGGSSDLNFFVGRYVARAKKYKHRPMLHPVIVLVDNDKGAKAVFAAVKQALKMKSEINFKSAEKYFHVGENLYVIKTPERGKSGESCIEDLFPKDVRSTKLNGKSFNPTNDAVGPTEYGKTVFAEQVIKANVNAIDFGGFEPLLERIADVIENHPLRPVVPAPATTPVAAHSSI